jgi:hypothetical protein
MDSGGGRDYCCHAGESPNLLHGCPLPLTVRSATGCDIPDPICPVKPNITQQKDAKQVDLPEV